VLADGFQICAQIGYRGLTEQTCVILFCVATRIDHGSVGIIDHAMPSMAIRGFIAHNRKSGAACLLRALLA
jgi:hypothetical protein